MNLRPLRIFGLGREGVNVDANPLELSDKELRQSQNAIRGNEGAEGALVLRPGLKKFNASAASGQILGSIGVPNAGKGGRRNTWGWNRPSDDSWLSWIGWANWAWGAFGWWDFWDWFDGPAGDPTEDPDTQTAYGAANDEPRTMYIAARVNTSGDNGYFYEWHKGDAAFENAGSVDHLGSPNILISAFESLNYIPTIGPDQRAPASYGPMYAICDGVVYYPGAFDSSEESHPWIRRGNVSYFAPHDRSGLLFKLPNGKPGDTNYEDTPVVLSLAAGGGYVYVAWAYSGPPSNQYSGKIHYFEPLSWAPRQLGDVTPDRYLPYALHYYLGRLWFGTYSGDNGFPGRVYYIRPGIDAAATLDHTFGSPHADVTVLCSFNGELFAGTQSGSNGTFAVIAKRDTLGAWTTSLTPTGGTAKAYNHFRSMVVFDGALYASFYNKDLSTYYAKIYKFDGTSWTTVYTGSAAEHSEVPFTLAVDNGLIYAYGGNNTSGYHTLLISADGTTWTDRSANLPLHLGANVRDVFPILFGVGPSNRAGE